MRLTVRTLLAWMDGMLAADDQAALAGKVAASPVASALMDRARRVVAHPAVSTLSPSGRGLADDPNTAAEFLDNALEPDRLEAFERVAVESDAHLADIAACHQILAELQREPQAVPSLDAPHLARLLHTALRRANHPLAAPLIEPGAGKPRDMAARGSAETRSPRRRAPLAAWISAAAAVALLAVLAGLLVWSIGGPTKSVTKARDIAAVEPPAQADDPQPARAPDPAAAAVNAAEPAAEPTPPEGREPPADPAAIAVVEPPTQPMPEPMAERVAAPPAAPAMSEPAADVAPPPPPMVAAAAAPQPDQRVPSGDAMAIVPLPVGPAAAATPGGAVEAAAIPAVAAPRIGGPLLHLVDVNGGQGWRLCPADGVPTDREDLLAPPGCRPVVVVNGVSLRLEPGTRAVVSHDADGSPRLELVFGRVVASAVAADARLAVAAGGLRGVLSGVMAEPAGIEVVLERDAGMDGAGHRRAILHAGRGAKVWTQTAGDPAAPPLVGIPPELLLPAETAIAWDDRDPAGATRSPSVADWISAAPRNDRTTGAAVVALAAAIGSDPEADVGPALATLATDRRIENRSIAAATLALLGDYAPLVRLLTAEPPARPGDAPALNERQWTALEAATVPLALARGENSAAALAVAMRDHGPPGKGELLATLARGFSDDDLAAGGDRLLVESLDDGSLAVRRYAIRRLLEIVQPEARRRDDYRADRPPLLRKDGQRWWGDQLAAGRIRRGLSADAPAAAARRPPARDDE